MRDIKKILSFRQDISPFLVHLTRNTIYDGQERSAKENLYNILNNKHIDSGDYLLEARYGWDKYWNLSWEEQLDFFTAICFTETPINEIHCLLEVIGREKNLSKYGLVFLKDRLKIMNVSPVWYINNWNEDSDEVFYRLCNIDDKDFKKKVLPLISIYGKKIKLPNSQERQQGDIDFIWEREWRRPKVYGSLVFKENDVFIGLCPDDEIINFERDFTWLKFIDPTKNVKWYAEKIIQEKESLELKHNIV